jgi:hypothetical protein
MDGAKHEEFKVVNGTDIVLMRQSLWFHRARLAHASQAPGAGRSIRTGVFAIRYSHSVLAQSRGRPASQSTKQDVMMHDHPNVHQTV